MVFGGLGPRHPAAVVSVSGSLSSKLSYGKLALPIMTPALKWSAELSSEWKKSYWGPEFIYFFIQLFFPRCFAFILFKCHYFPPSSPPPACFVKCSVTRSETTVADTHTFNLAEIEPQRATFTSTSGPLVKFCENVSRHAAGVVDTLCRKQRMNHRFDRWTPQNCFLHELFSSTFDFKL